MDQSRPWVARVYLGLGSNLGDRREQLEAACAALLSVGQELKVSAIYETPALLVDGAPREWNRPYLNAVLSLETHLSPHELLAFTQSVELKAGREQTEKWAPRPLDVDILFFQGIQMQEHDLQLPHPEISERAFVLDPLAEMGGGLDHHQHRIRLLARNHPQHQAALMGVLNLTPDSFSDGGRYPNLAELERVLDEWDQINIAWLDLGAESTRPGSESISALEEWSRLEPVILKLQRRYQGKAFRPKISIDTQRAETAEKALRLGASAINDVSGLADPEMIDVLAQSSCDYVLMHSLSVPPRGDRVISRSLDPVTEVKSFFHHKIAQLEAGGIQRSRIILDPGIGFGKTSLHSLQLIKRFQEFADLDCRLLCGHSRKSFMSDWSSVGPSDRDFETLGLSLSVLGRGVDILRVHNPVLHHRVILAACHAR